ncbi:MAG: SPFH domain-containing protein, partial [Actinomycetota bacterium]|nr:SPFH domain-containing protein [Actinomycetota bacterium]
MFTFVLLAVIALVVVVFLIAGVKIVRPYERGIVERLGKYKETKESGLQIIVPFIDTIQRV